MINYILDELEENWNKEFDIIPPEEIDKIRQDIKELYKEVILYYSYRNHDEELVMDTHITSDIFYLVHIDCGDAVSGIEVFKDKDKLIHEMLKYFCDDNNMRYNAINYYRNHL